MVQNKSLTEHFAGKKILITGASGFIGSHLSDRLLNFGAIVYGTSRTKRESKNENLIWWEGTFEDYSTTEKLIKRIKPDYIYHLAGEVTAANKLDFVLPTFNSLLTSTVNLLTAATEAEVGKIILTGSSTEPLDEQPFPNSPYSAAKWATNAYGHLFQKVYKAPVVIVRPFMGYGPGQDVRKLIPYVIQSLLKGESPKLSTGSWVTDWVYIDDTVDGILTSSLYPNPEGKTIDLGSGRLTSVKEIVQMLVEIIKPTGNPLFGALPDRHQEHTRKADTSYAKEHLGWHAKIQLEEGLGRTVEYYRNVIS